MIHSFKGNLPHAITDNIIQVFQNKTLLQCNKITCSYYFELKNLIFSVSFVSFFLGTSPFKEKNGIAVKMYINFKKQRVLLGH